MKVALALALLAPFALASHTPYGICDGEGVGIVEVTGGTPGTTFYVDDRGAHDNGVWTYIETNGIWTGRGPGVFADDVAAHNLQRGMALRIVPTFMDAETCVDTLGEIPDGVLIV